MPNPDPYTILGIPKDAPPEAIRQAHRRAKRAHRDADMEAMLRQFGI